MNDNYKSRSRERSDREFRQDTENRPKAPASSTFDNDSLPKAPAAYFHSQSRSGWDYEPSGYAQNTTAAWGGSSEVYSASAESYNQHYANYYRDPAEYYQEGYSQQVYHTAEGVAPPPPPFPPAGQVDNELASIPPPPPPPIAAWPRYTYDGLPTGPAAERSSNIPLDDHENANGPSDASHTLGVDNVSQNIDLQVLKNIGYPIRASDEPTEKYEKIGQVGEGTYG